MVREENEKVKSILELREWSYSDEWNDETLSETASYKKMTKEELKAALIKDGILKRKKSDKKN